MGPIGNRHADMYQADALAELAGVCDLRQDRADAAGKRLGVPAFSDAAKMLAELKPDVCSVTTGGYEYGSDHFRADDACALEARLPCAGGESRSPTTSPTPSGWWPGAGNRGGCYGINMNHRFTPAAYLAKKWLDEGRLGHLLFVNMSMWIKNPAESSPYFQIKALHPHTVDILRHFCGDIAAVQCFATKAPGRAIWSTAHFSLKFKNGVVGGLTRLLRHSERASHGTLRGGWHRRAVCALTTCGAADAVSGGKPGKNRLHKPCLRRHARFCGYVPQPHSPLP